MTDNSRLLFAEDCLFAMRRLNEEFPNGYADLIYLDPPFNSKTTYNLPFKKDYENYKPAKAFKDTWFWDEKIGKQLYKWENCIDVKRTIARIISASCYIQHNYKTTSDSMPTYLFYMAERLLEMRVALKKTGSIYLHCDPTASHYLKLLMDAIFGKDNFRNEIVWHHPKIGIASNKWTANTDTILFYVKDNIVEHSYNKQVLDKPNELYNRWKSKIENNKLLYGMAKNIKDSPALSKINVLEKKLGRPLKDDDIVIDFDKSQNKKAVDNVWLLSFVKGNSKESTGYPTQKPVALLERIIKASSNEGDTILDPFCGCGTSIHAAEKLKRKWIGMDISAHSIGLVQLRIVSDKEINKKRKILPLIKVFGMFLNEKDAKKRAENDRYDFEKVTCGMLMCLDLFENKRPGKKGPDRGVDGVIPIRAMTRGGKEGVIIVQVKSGKVTVDSVKALKQTVDDIEEAVMGIFVCFEDQIGVVERNRSKKMVTIQMGLFTKEYPMIQGLSVKDLIAGNADKLDLPIQSFIR